MKFCFQPLFIASIIASMGLSSVAFATLGESESSVDQNLRAFNMSSAAVSTVTQELTHGHHLTVHHMSVQANAIKQYADSHGTIFAVTWSGPSMPPLSELMGRYFAEYNLALAAKIKIPGRRHLNVTTSSIQVMQQGPLMHLHGIAYLIGKVPEGLQVEDLP